jgi:hypothetical protein
VTDPLKLELVLDSDSHARARSVVASINARFPRGPGEGDQTARGRGGETLSKGDGSNEAVSAQSIAISIPRAYKDTPAEFLQLLRYTRIDPGFPQEFARRYVEELKASPALSEQIGWCLKAIGKTAVPFLVPMYDYPEYSPRMAALDAGAFHGDPRAVPHLVDLAEGGPPAIKTQAIKLLGRMPANPAINLALRKMVDSPELDVRVAAYEALSARRDPLIDSVPVGPDPDQPKFTLETVAAAEEMVYVTQQGEPKIVIFGGGLGAAGAGGAERARRDLGVVRLSRPTLVSAWSDRFMLSSECATCDVRLFYRHPRTGAKTEQKVTDDLGEFVLYLAHKPSPEEPAPGLDMSYSEVVGLLYELSRQSGVAATFATEQDRLRAEIYEAAQATALADRPETTEGTEAVGAAVFRPTEPAPLRPVDGAPAGFDKPRIVPLAKPVAKPGKAAAE